MPRYSREAAQALAMTIPPLTGRALTTGITHVISLNVRNGSPGRCCHDPTGQMKRLRLGEDTPWTQPAREACGLTPGPTGLTTPPPRVSQVKRAMRVSWASLLCKNAEDPQSEKEPRTDVCNGAHRGVDSLWIYSPIALSFPAFLGYVCLKVKGSSPP